MELVLGGIIVLVCILSFAGGMGAAKASEYPLQLVTADENRAGRNNLLLGLVLAILAAVGIALIGGGA